MWQRNFWNGCGIFHLWHVQDKNSLAALRFVHWSNRSYVLNNFSLEYRLYLANCAEKRLSAGLHLLSRVLVEISLSLYPISAHSYNVTSPDKEDIGQVSWQINFINCFYPTAALCTYIEILYGWTKHCYLYSMWTEVCQSSGLSSTVQSCLMTWKIFSIYTRLYCGQ